MERDNSLLTDSQRKYLRTRNTEDGDYSRQMDHYLRNGIQDRVQSGILDFALLFEHLNDQERREIFGPSPIADEFGKGLASAIALIYRETMFFGRWENLLYRGVNLAEADIAGVGSDTPFKASVTFDVDHVDHADIYAAFDRVQNRNFRELSDGEAHALVWLLSKASRRDGAFEEALEAANRDLEEFATELRDENVEARDQRAKNVREEQGQREKEARDNDSDE